jgi:hypothetical protein
MQMDIETTCSIPDEEVIASMNFLTPRSTQYSHGIGMLCSSLANIETQLTWPGDSFPDIEKGSIFLDVPDFNLLLGSHDQDTSINQGFASYGSMEEMDLQFLSSLDTLLPFQVEDIIPDLSHRQGSTAPPTGLDPGGPASVCSEAFRNSHWRFRPDAHDYAGAEVRDLSAMVGSEDNDSTSSRVLGTDRVTAAKLKSTTRDQIVTMIAMNCLPADIQKAVSCFPSTELLDSILQFYLTSAIANAVSFIHVPTFDPNELRPELLAAMAAAGAVLTSDPVLTKLGHAIQECVRMAIPKRVGA